MTTTGPLPAGARILHVGPHKTGTTALQSALHQARTELEDQGVSYLSRGRHDASAARWATDRLVVGSDRRAAEDRWDRIVSELRSTSSQRRLFSSEFLSDATDDQIDEILDRIGRQDLWVLITLRPLARILPSQYQQGLQSGGRREYDEWLRAVLDPDHPRPAPRQFWLRHRHDELVRRWAARLGSDKVIVVVLDPADREFLPRTFESILGLTNGTLTAKPALENRSLTAAEAEMIRMFNVQYRQEGLRPESHARMLIDIGNHLKQRVPPADETRLITPAWAVSRANEIAMEMADNLGRLDVDVRGDLTLLTKVSLPDDDQTTVPSVVSSELAAYLGIGVAQGLQRLSAQPSQPHRPAAVPPTPGPLTRLLRAVRARSRNLTFR